MKIFYTLLDLAGQRIALKVGFPSSDNEEKYCALGHFKQDSKTAEIFVYCPRWAPTLLHECLEDQMFMEGARYSESLSGNTFLFMFDHDKFNHICDAAHDKYVYIKDIVQQTFQEDIFGNLIAPKGKKIPKGWGLIVSDDQYCALDLEGSRKNAKE